MTVLPLQMADWWVLQRLSDWQHHIQSHRFKAFWKCGFISSSAEQASALGMNIKEALSFRLPRLNPASRNNSDLPTHSCRLYILSAFPSTLKLVFPPPSLLCQWVYPDLSKQMPPLAEQTHPACSWIWIIHWLFLSKYESYLLVYRSLLC